VSATDHGAHAPHRGGPAVVALAIGIPMLASMMALAVAPGVLAMAREFGDLTAQLVLTLPALVMILGAATAGFLSERWGRRLVIATCLALYAVSGLAGAVVPSLGTLVATRMVIGFCGGVLLTAIYAVIGEYFEGPRRERVLGFMSTAGSLTSLALLVAMGAVVERHGWRAPFLIYAAGFVFVPLALRGLHRGRPAAAARLGWTPVARQWRLYLLLTAYTIGMYMMVIQGPFLLAAKGETSAIVIGRLIALSSLIGALGGVLYGSLRRVVGFRGMFVLISLAIGFGLPLTAWAPGLAVIVLGMIVTGLGIGVIEPTAASELLLRTPEPLHDRAMGVNVAAMFLGQFLNPLVVAGVRDLGGIVLAFVAIGGAYLVSGLLFAAARPATGARAHG